MGLNKHEHIQISTIGTGLFDRYDWLGRSSANRDSMVAFDGGREQRMGQ